jgi:putative ABC transport system permease protein
VGGALLVLLVGTVNSNLALARATFRTKEMSTRLAVGASYARIARQFLTECVMVTLCGGIAGLAVGAVGAVAVRFVTSYGLDRLPRATEIHMDWAVVVFSLVLAVIAGILIGIFGLLRFLRLDLNKALHSQGRAATGGTETQWIRGGLVVMQFALALVLLAGAGFLAVSFQQLLASDPGFKPEGVLTAATNLPNRTPEAQHQFMDRALDAIRQIPGVVAAGATTNLPLSGNNSDSAILNLKPDDVILAEGYLPKDGESIVAPLQIGATTGYFEAMGIGLVSGRYFNEHDNPDSAPVIIIDETLARKFWPGRDAVGRRMYRPGNPRNLAQIDEHTRWFTVAGVVRSVKMDDLASTSNQAGAFYIPASQIPFGFIRLAIKTTTDLAATARD